MDIIPVLESILIEDDLNRIKKRIVRFKDTIRENKSVVLMFSLNGDNQSIKKDLLMRELKQIQDTRTIERTKYYVRRLIKSLSVQKEGKINDLNLNRWKEYDDIITDSLWILGKRDASGAHNADYWGNFIPQIPNQLLRRFTKKGEWVLDTFLGSGTTLIECKRLGRNGIGIELNKGVSEKAKSTLRKEKNHSNSIIKVINANSTNVNYKPILKKQKINSVQFIIMHPPYWDIIRFSDNKEDLSNAVTVENFLKMFGQVADNSFPYLDKGRYCSVIIGDKYSSGEWIPLGFFVMNEMLNRGFKLKSTIIKNFEQTTAKRNQKELWRYRALAGGFYIFKHEYIFLFQKKE